LKGCQQLGDVGRVVLAVAIQGDEDVAPGRHSAGADAPALAQVAAMAQHPQGRVARVAVLGVRDDQQRVVAGERVDRGRVGVPVDHPRGAGDRCQPQLAAVVGGASDRDEPEHASSV